MTVMNFPHLAAKLADQGTPNQEMEAVQSEQLLANTSSISALPRNVQLENFGNKRNVQTLTVCFH